MDVEESTTGNITITNNTFTNTNGAPGQTIDVQTEDLVAVGSGATACVSISGNTNSPNTITVNEGAATTLTVDQDSAANLTRS